MKIDFIHEPELEFGAGRHIDSRFGLINYGPLDMQEKVAPRQIEVGIAGTREDIESTVSWLERCRSPIAAKKSSHPNLAPAFPGFREDVGFFSNLILDPSMQREIPTREFQALKEKGDSELLVRESVKLFSEAFKYLSDHTAAKVLLCPVPQQLVELLNPDTRPDKKLPPDFHDLLKAETLRLKPMQMMLPSTADPKLARKLKIRDQVKSVQDDATRAWNFHTALYYKAHGRPWRLPRVSSDLKTCFVGISFYRSVDRTRVMVSMAQVFDERGEGVVVRGGKVDIPRDDRTPHLSGDAASTLIVEALKRYRAVHKHPPARLVIHKTSSFNAAELSGFRSGAQQERIEVLDFISFSENAEERLFRHGLYPPLRGTVLALDKRQHLIYTRGSVEFFETYPGMYVPRPLLFRCEEIEESPKNLAREILALTKMDWNRTRFDGHVPLTIEAARRVGDTLRYVPEEQKDIADSYAHYM